MTNLRSLAAASLYLALLGSCVSTHDTPKSHDLTPRQVAEVARYEVRAGGRTIGVVLLLEIRDPSGPLRFWRIETRDGSWAGHATEQGRFSRRMPFQDEDVDLGIWPMAQGVAKVLDVSGSVQLVEAVAPEPTAAKPMR